MRLLTRRQIIDRWEVDDRHHNKYCCPDCRDILSYNAVEGYFCNNSMCRSEFICSEEDIEDIDDE